MMMRLLLAALALMTAPLAAPAQTYPDRAIRIVSGTQTGTSGDLAGRLLAVKLTAVFGQSVVFESRPGANGALAANYVKSLPPDGYGILFLASSTIITGPLMVKNVGFEALRDFTPISLAVAVPSYLVVNSSLAVDNVSSLIDYAKRNPGKLAYGSVGRGSAFHLIGESFKLATGIDMLHVPYTGANNANIIGDLLNNRIQVYFPAYPAVLSALPTGQVKLLAVFQTARVKQSARASDRERDAAQQQDRAVVVRLHGTCRPAAADRRAPAGGDPQGARGSRGDLQARGGRDHPGRQHELRDGGGDPHRHRRYEQAREGARDRAAIAARSNAVVRGPSRHPRVRSLVIRRRPRRLKRRIR